MINFKTLFKILLSITFVILIFLKINIQETITAMGQINLGILLIYPIFVINGFFLNSFNIYLLLKAIKNPLNFKKVFKSYIQAWLFGKASTGKSGEISILYFLKQNGSQTHNNLFVVIIDKIITLIILIILALIGTFYLFKEFLVLILILAFILFITLTLTLYFSDFFKLYILRGYSTYFKKFKKNLKFLILNNKKYLFIIFLITFAKLINTTFIIFTIFLAMEKYVSPLIILLIGSIEGIVTQIPISFSGIGVSEGIAIILYQYINIEPHLALSAYLYVRIFGYLFAIIIYFIHLLSKKNKN